MRDQAADKTPPPPAAPSFFDRPFGHEVAIVGAVIFGFATLAVLLWR